MPRGPVLNRRSIRGEGVFRAALAQQRLNRRIAGSEAAGDVQCGAHASTDGSIEVNWVVLHQFARDNVIYVLSNMYDVFNDT